MKPIFQQLRTILQIDVDVAVEGIECVVVKVPSKGENFSWGSAWNETTLLKSLLTALQINVTMMVEGIELLQLLDW